jgi:hypothetical protein
VSLDHVEVHGLGLGSFFRHALFPLGMGEFDYPLPTHELATIRLVETNWLAAYIAAIHGQIESHKDSQPVRR